MGVERKIFAYKTVMKNFRDFSINCIREFSGNDNKSLRGKRSITEVKCENFRETEKNFRVDFFLKW